MQRDQQLSAVSRGDGRHARSFSVPRASHPGKALCLHSLQTSAPLSYPLSLSISNWNAPMSGLLLPCLEDVTEKHVSISGTRAPGAARRPAERAGERGGEAVHTRVPHTEPGFQRRAKRLFRESKRNMIPSPDQQNGGRRALVRGEGVRPVWDTSQKAAGVF